jgi:two-component system response regulator (stage 0 sporulation protein F)
MFFLFFINGGVHFLLMYSAEVKRILVIEDEGLIRSCLARALRKEGVVISEAQDCHVAREKLRDEGCDLAIVDLCLEDGMDGLKLIPEIHQQVSRAKIIVITAFGTPEVKEAALAGGADRFYEKPFDIDEIRNSVDELLHDLRNSVTN